MEDLIFNLSQKCDPNPGPIVYNNTTPQVAPLSSTESMTWLQYYQAVKSGDLETVRKATDKDFRVTLTMDRSAIELAALYGHNELFDYFLSQAETNLRKVHSDYNILWKVYLESLHGGQLEISRQLTEILKDQPMLVKGDFHLAALEGRSLECLKSIIMRPAQNMDNVYFQEVFYNVCSTASLEYLIKILKLKDGSVASTVAGLVDVPEFFINIGLNQWDAVRRHINSDKRWHERAGLWTPMDVAAMFGKLDILRKMIDKMDQEQLLYFHRNMTSTMSYALRKNRKEILEYLVDYGLAKPRPPCEYPGFEINEAFYYLKKQTEDLKLDSLKAKNNAYVDNFKDCLKVMHDYPEFERTRGSIKSLSQWTPPNSGDRSKYWMMTNSASRLTKISEYYDYLVDTWRWGKGPWKSLNFDTLFIRALSEQNVDAALALLKLTKSLDCKTNPNFHKYITRLMVANPRRFGMVTSPVVMEILLDHVMKGLKSCVCEDRPVDLMEMFAEYSVTDDKMDLYSKFPLDVEQALPLRVMVRRVEVVLELLVNYGYEKPSKTSLDFILMFFFRMDHHLPFAAAHVLALLQCCQIDLDEEFVLDCSSQWFGGRWCDRDEFLTEFFLALSRNDSRQNRFEIECLVLYFVSPKERREHFINCVEKLGLNLTDEEFFYGEITQVRYAEYLEMKQKWKKLPRMPSLQESARFAVHNHCLKVAATRPRYLSARSAVHAVSKSLPRPLARYLNYADIYKTLAYMDLGYMAMGLVRQFDYMQVQDDCFMARAELAIWYDTVELADEESEEDVDSTSDEEEEEEEEEDSELD